MSSIRVRDRNEEHELHEASTKPEQNKSFFPVIVHQLGCYDHKRPKRPSFCCLIKLRARNSDSRSLLDTESERGTERLENKRVLMLVVNKMMRTKRGKKMRNLLLNKSLNLREAKRRRSSWWWWWYWFLLRLLSASSSSSMWKVVADRGLGSTYCSGQVSEVEYLENENAIA
ncbi:hypothetical protein M0R45_015611 [Rubus argutus]|uniref:Uncharacterized protein n=1 Tax=Rubus argutus TaxID=59490 RepID=A0AAW1XR50_RUBAR